MATAMPTARLFKAPHMRYPDWLFKAGHLSSELFKDRNEAQQEYILFFTLKNAECQREIFGRLIDRLNESQTAYNPYDYSDSAMAYAKSYILHQVGLWRESFDPLFKNFDQGLFEDFLFVEMNVEKGIKINPSAAAADMFQGKIAEDFLADHPGTELQFHRFVMKKMIHSQVRSTGHGVQGDTV